MADPRLQTLRTITRGGANDIRGRWLAVEEALGLQLPGSYKKLVDLYGASTWCGFLYVLSPFDDRWNLPRISEQELQADRGCRADFPSHYPLPLYPEPGGLLPWAVTVNGDTFSFITRGPPDEWPTVIKDARAPEFEVSFLPPALLVHHFAAGILQSTVLPVMEK